MSSRIDGESTCVRCGEIIISINPRLKMCSVCEKEVMKDGLKRIANRKEPTNVKRFKLKIPRLAGLIGKR